MVTDGDGVGLVLCADGAGNSAVVFHCAGQLVAVDVSSLACQNLSYGRGSIAGVCIKCAGTGDESALLSCAV